MTESAGDNAKLNRTLGLPLVTLYGLGNILGAGIYVLIGKVAGFAGSSTILALSSRWSPPRSPHCPTWNLLAAIR